MPQLPWRRTESRRRHQTVPSPPTLRRLCLLADEGEVWFDDVAVRECSSSDLTLEKKYLNTWIPDLPQSAGGAFGELIGHTTWSDRISQLSSAPRRHFGTRNRVGRANQAGC